MVLEIQIQVSEIFLPKIAVHIFYWFIFDTHTATQPPVSAAASQPTPKSGSIDISHILGTSEMGANANDEDIAMQDAT